MRFHRLRSVVIAWIGAAVVGGAGAASGQLLPGGPPASRPEVEAACSNRNWLAFTEGREGTPAPKCPEVTGWRLENLFREPLRQDRRFCRYEFVEAVAPAPQPPVRRPDGGKLSAAHRAAIEALKANGELRGTVRRCAVVGTSPEAPTPLATANHELLYRELRYQVGATDLPLAAGKPNVLLSIVDTQKTGNGAPANPSAAPVSPHGYALAHIARDLTCGTGSSDQERRCAAAIDTRLALGRGKPLLGETGFSAAGGSVGSPSDLAMAIVDEVRAWKAAASTSPTAPRHLVLNLSLGWDPELLQAERGPGGVNAEEVAVYDALVFAREQGALPIAAAGNGHGGTLVESGATLPARWYAASPSFAAPRSGSPEPVVWAIGAINRNDVPLANSRPGSTPPLVAYGDHAVVPTPTSWTDPLTGTSVSTVVASSIAAVVWHLRPELAADEVMALLERSAIILGRKAELYRGMAAAANTATPRVQRPVASLAPQVGRLSFTRAMTRAWSRPTFHSSQLSFVANPTVSCGTTSVRSCDADGDGDADEQVLVCSGTATSGAGCPVRHRALSSVPWVLPQPDSDPCANCTLGGGKPPSPRPYPRQSDNTIGVDIGGVANDAFFRTASTTPVGASAAAGSGWRAYLELAPTWPHCLTDLVIDVQFPGTTERRKFWIAPGSAPFCTGSLKVEDLPFSSEPSAAALIANVNVDGVDYTVRSPLYVGWTP